MHEDIRGFNNAGVQTSCKHWIGNKQEIMRNLQYDLDGTVTDMIYKALSLNINDHTLLELYMWPFADAVKAGTSSIMCPYQRLNGSYGCQNSKMLNGLLKTELGFRG